MKRAGGILTLDSLAQSNILWSLREPSSNEPSICEMQTCEDTRPPFVYIEDKTLLDTEKGSSDNHNANLKCIPSGWFVSDSVTWFKDGVAFSSGSFENHLSVTLNVPFQPKDILQFQGYYWCSVDIKIPYKQIYSPKILIRSPGLHTFVLYMKSAVGKFSYCSPSLSLTPSLELDEFLDELNECLREFFPEESWYALKDVTCIASELHIYNHVHIPKEAGDEEAIRKIFEERSKDNDKLSGILKKLLISKENTIFRSTVACPREESSYNRHTLTWPETPIGQSTLSEEMCITVEGDALERECFGDFTTGAYWGLVVKDCANIQSEVTNSLYELSKKDISEENILNSTLTMESLTINTEEINSADVTYISQILENVADVPSIQSEILEPVVNTLDTVINAISTLDNRNDLTHASSRAISSMENILSNAQTNGQVIQVARNNISVSALPLNGTVIYGTVRGVLGNWGSNITTIVNDSSRLSGAWFEQHGNFEAAVLFPGKFLSQNISYGVTNMAVAIRKNMHYLKDSKVISPVIDVAIGNERICNVDPPVEMVFKVPKIRSPKKSPWGCVFWDERLNDYNGGWSYKGCNSILINSTHVRCFCNHLTSFAVILRLHQDQDLTKIHQNFLSIITYTGCCLSILGLGIIILTFLLFKKWRADVRHKVLFNFSVALVSFLLIFLIGIEKTAWKPGCQAIAVLLHYFMLATFTWMLVEAFIQYLNLVKVIGTYIPNLIQKAMLFAWGIPLLIVAIILAVDTNHYFNEDLKHCWLSDRVFYYAVAAPIVLMLLVNYVTFTIILYSNTCGRKSKQLRTNQSERREMIIRAKAVFCASVLLGLSWIFGCLADIKGAELVCEYLFAITTTLQGFILSIFFVFRRKNTRDLWLSVVKKQFESDANQKTSGIQQNSNK